MHHGPLSAGDLLGAPGLGAFLNDTPIQVSGCRQLDEALLVTGFAYTGKIDWTTITPSSAGSRIEPMACAVVALQRLIWPSWLQADRTDIGNGASPMGFGGRCSPCGIGRWRGVDKARPSPSAPAGLLPVVPSFIQRWWRNLAKSAL